ncbi:hypothetical protein RAD16_16840 [Bradyrhizobium sp. 18BD]
MIIHVSAGMASWIFKPYVRPCEQARVFNFEREAERLLNWPWLSFRATINNPAMLSDLVLHKTKVLAAAYKSAFGDRNLTSLCVYSGPQRTGGSGKMLFLNLMTFDHVEKIGWLGTGDIPLKGHVEAADLLEHYKQQAQVVSTFGLPHHGSVKNYSSSVVAALRPAGLCCLGKATEKLEAPASFGHGRCRQSRSDWSPRG